MPSTMTASPRLAGFEGAAWSALAAGDEPGAGHGCVAVRSYPAREQRTTAWPGWVSASLRDRFAVRGIREPYEHQHRALELLHAGRHVALTTGTSSGKSLPFHVLALHGAATGQGRRGGTTLYLGPTKALTADQALSFSQLDDTLGVTLDGDTPGSARLWARDHAHLVFTNPDMLHHTLLPQHTRWRSFLRRLSLVVVDESHVYRGTFGAHTSQVFRRLRRVAAHHGAHPVWLLASATSANPREHAEALTGLNVTVIDDDASPAPPRTFAVWQPQSRADGARPSAFRETAALLGRLTDAHCSTLAFVRSRQGCEALATAARDRLVDAAQRPRVAAYRGGFLPEERRDAERAMRSGDLLALACTSALELGINLTGLDAVLVCGWPGTRAALWQRWGRAGRADRPAVGVFVAGDDPLDQYLAQHPEMVFDAPAEKVVCDPHNPMVCAPHLVAAAAELPLTEDDAALFGPATPELMRYFVDSGYLRERADGLYWTRSNRPTEGLSLRGQGQVLRLIEHTTGRVLGTMDAESAPAQVHAGAVYTHQGDTYAVRSLDTDGGVAQLTSARVEYRTRSRSTTSVQVTATHDERVWRGVDLARGTVTVTTRVTGFDRISAQTGKRLSRHALQLEPSTLTTQAMWLAIDDDVLDAAGIPADLTPGALHAAEHTMIGLLPLHVTCDRWDLGGLSTALHPDTGKASIFVYDAYSGGAGFSYSGFEQIEAWCETTRRRLRECPCEAGCPACVHSPKCGNGNDMLDKHAALVLVDHLLTR